MKKLLTLLLVLMLVLSFTACGGGGTDNSTDNSGQEQANAEGINEEFDGSLIEKTAVDTLNMEEHPVYMKYKITFDGQTMEAFMMADGDKLYSESATPDGRAGTLIDGDTTYVILHDQKMYMKSIAADESIMPDIMEESEEDFKDVEITTGTEDYNGVTYISETITEDGIEAKYLFDKDTKAWKYMISEGTVMEILEISENVDNSLLSVPAGYTEMSM